jgi:adenosylcobinamide kinase/adenosylcobinamide-phosphate guanylyltransferase
VSLTLVTGGVRSGKSRHAESLLDPSGPARYVVPGRSHPDDEEWAARVAAHQARRPGRWETVETVAIAEVLTLADQRPVIVDCLGTWVAALIDDAGSWDDPPRARSVVGAAVREFVAAGRAAPYLVVVVSNEVGWGVVPATASGRLFRDLLGAATAAVSAAADHVALVVAGRVLDLSAAVLVRP